MDGEKRGLAPQYDPPKADKSSGATPVKQQQQRFHWAPRGGIFDRRGKQRRPVKQMQERFHRAGKQRQDKMNNVKILALCSPSGA